MGEFGSTCTRTRIEPVPVLTGPGLYGYGYGYQPSHHITSHVLHTSHVPFTTTLHHSPPLHHYQRRPHGQHYNNTTRHNEGRRRPHGHITTTRHDITKAGGKRRGRDGPSCPSLIIGMMFEGLKIVVLTNYTTFAGTTTWPGVFTPPRHVE